ncbi:MAG: hypothetical protein ACK5MT_01725 [Actinomycetales bacterium]
MKPVDSKQNQKEGRLLARFYAECPAVRNHGEAFITVPLVITDYNKPSGYPSQAWC